MPSQIRLYRTGDLRQILGERFNDSADALGHAAERADYWKSVYGLTSITERYLVWGLVIHVHLLPRASSGITVPICFSLTCEKAFASGAGWESEARVQNVLGYEHDDVVLVGVVQLVQQPEGIEGVPIPGVVRLKPLNRCDVFASQIVKPPARELRALLDRGGGLGIEEERKGRVVHHAEVVISRRLFEQGELTDELVERRAEIVGNLTDQHWPARWELDLPTWIEVIEAGLRISLAGDDSGTDVVAEESLALVIEQIDVLVSDDNFPTWPIEPTHGGSR